MKFVRVILAVEDDKLERLDDYMTCVIETDVIPDEFRVDDRGRPALADSVWASNPIQGAYTSGAYTDRDEAINGSWIAADDIDLSSSFPVETPDTTALAEFLLESEVDGPEMIELLEPFMTRTAIASLCGRLELCPIHHYDATACADDDVKDCEHFR